MTALANLKSAYEDFELIDTPDLIINWWTYNFFVDHLPCVACSTYSSYCEKELRKRWMKEWGPCDRAIERIIKCDSDFLNVSLYSALNKSTLIKDLIDRNN